MNPSPSSAANPLPFTRYVVVSTVVHLLGFLTALIIIPRLQLPTIQQPLSVVMIELPRGPSEEVGLGINPTNKLPDAPLPKEIPEPPTARPTTPPMPEVKPEKPVAQPIPKKPTEPQLTPEERKMREALSKIDNDIKDRGKAPETAQAKNPSEGFKYGTSDTPLKTIPPEAELMRYRAMVRARILREWIPPPGTRDLPPNARPATTISIRVGPSGQVTATGWVKRSNNLSYDASTMRAVQRASPLPLPPESIREMALAEGFTVDFVLR